MLRNSQRHFVGPDQIFNLISPPWTIITDWKHSDRNLSSSLISMWMLSSKQKSYRLQRFLESHQCSWSHDCSSVCSGLNDAAVSRLQSVQHTAAKLLHTLRTVNTSLQLHVHCRIQFNQISTCYSCILYLRASSSWDPQRINDSYRVKGQDSNTGLCFTVSASTLWNKLALTVRSAQSVRCSKLLWMNPALLLICHIDPAVCRFITVVGLLPTAAGSLLPSAAGSLLHVWKELSLSVTSL